MLAVVATVAAAIYAISNDPASKPWMNVVDDFALLFAFAACIHAALGTRGDLQLMWRFVAAAVLCWTVGEVIFDFRELALGMDPESMISTILYSAFYPLLIAGLLIRDRGARPTGFDIHALDAVVVALAVAVVAYGLIYDHPVSGLAQPVSGLEAVVFPVINGLLIWSVAYQFYTRLIFWTVTRSLLSLGVVAMFASVVLWSIAGAAASAAAVSLAMTMFGIAALASPVATRIGTADGGTRRAIAPELVLFASYAGVVAVTFYHFYTDNPVLVALASASTLVVIVRLGTVLAQNDRLLVSAELRAATDALTGLANLQQYRDRLDAEFARTDREDGSLALLLIDIDNFKTINDLAGHHAGDRVLIEVSETMRRTFRQFDIPCRIGGDEFAMIAPQTGTAAALEIAERLCRAVKEITVEEYPDLPPVSVSIGCCVYPTLASDPEELIGNADQALYVVKQNERGGAELFSPDKEQPVDDAWQLARVRAELAAREADFQAVFRHAREAMGIFDEKGVLLMVNDVTAQTYGTTRERMVGRKFSDFVEASAVSDFIGKLPQLEADGEMSGKVKMHLGVGPDHPGVLSTVSYSTSRFAPNRYLAIMWDVTEKERAQVKLSESERRFRAVFENSVDAMFVTDNDGVVQDANLAAAEMVEQPLSELVGTPVHDLVHPEEMGEVIQQVDELREIESMTGTMTTRNPSGDLRTVEYTAVADFVPGLHLSIVRDVTDRVNAGARKARSPHGGLKVSRR